MFEVKFGILDFFRTADLKNASDASRKRHSEAVIDTVIQAKLAEASYYDSYWIGEHHNSYAVHAAPEIMIASVAAQTTRIVVGSGAVLLPYYSPFRVAEVYKALNITYPGRINLGVARSLGVSSKEIAIKLLAGRKFGYDPDAFHEKLNDLLKYLSTNDLYDEENPPAENKVSDVSCTLMGSSNNSLRIALSLGIGYTMDLFSSISAADSTARLEVLHNKRDEITDKGINIGLSIAVMCQESASSAVKRDSYLASYGFGRHNFVGTPPECAERIFSLAESTQARQILISTWSADIHEREYIITALGEMLAKRNSLTGGKYA